MKKTFALFLAACAAALIAGPASAELIGISSSSPGQLYRINAATGAATGILTLDRTPTFSGFEIIGGVGYATDIVNPSGGLSFGRIDLSTGAVTLLSNQDGSFNWWGLAPTPTGQLWTVDSDVNTLKLVNPATGTTTTVGPTGVTNLGAGLAFDSVTGTLYSVAFNGNLYTLNTTTGAATLVGPTGLVFANVHQGLAFDADTGVLYLNEADTFDSLFTVNTATGAATLVGPNGVVAGFGIDGLTFVSSRAVREPASLALLAIGLAWLGVRSRRREAHNR